MKNAFVDALFVELKGPSAFKAARGKGSTAKVAISRAFGNLLKQTRGKRFQTIKATITITESQPQEDTVGK